MVGAEEFGGLIHEVKALFVGTGGEEERSLVTGITIKRGDITALAVVGN